MNRQYIFNRVCAHLFVQGEKSSLDEKTGYCYYRHPRKPYLRCAIGGILPQRLCELAQRNGGGAITIMNAIPQIREYFQAAEPRDDSFLLAVQNIHDEYPVYQWAQRLREFAKCHSLSIPAIISRR